jgi:hypothetical protein
MATDVTRSMNDLLRLFQQWGMASDNNLDRLQNDATIKAKAVQGYSLTSLTQSFCYSVVLIVTSLLLFDKHRKEWSANQQTDSFAYQRG